MEKNVTMKTNKQTTPITYDLIRKYAKATWALFEKSPYLKNAVAAYTGVLGQQPFVDKWTFSTNGVAIAGRNGIPCLGLGPGNEVYAHAANEACPIEHLNAAVAFYAAFVAKLNGKV